MSVRRYTQRIHCNSSLFIATSAWHRQSLEPVCPFALISTFFLLQKEPLFIHELYICVPFYKWNFVYLKKKRNINKLTFNAFDTCMALTLISIIRLKHQHRSMYHLFFSLFKMTKRYSIGVFVVSIVVIVFVVVCRPKSDVKHRSTRQYQIR